MCKGKFPLTGSSMCHANPITQVLSKPSSPSTATPHQVHETPPAYTPPTAKNLTSCTAPVLHPAPEPEWGQAHIQTLGQHVSTCLHPP